VVECECDWKFWFRFDVKMKDLGGGLGWVWGVWVYYDWGVG
jgi:hypothetical protein